MTGELHFSHTHPQTHTHTYICIESSNVALRLSHQ
uniref:Uncharacterized protein n=1 Tax=Anguilla anguilla TaxID=7936 RepID=A0A0E9QQ18_ANGAN